MPLIETTPATRSPEAARVALVASAFLAIRAYAFTQADPVGAAESAYLSLLAGGVLAAVAALAPRPARELYWTAIAVTTAIWIVGYGAHRGALVTLLLVAGLAMAALRAGDVLASPGASAALALGLQLITRCDLLLPPLLDPRTLVSVLALPVACGVSLHILARRFGAHPAGIAGAATVVLSPGWNVTVTLALASLAAGAVAADRQAAPALRWAAAAALAVPPVWNPSLGVLFVLGAFTFLVEGRASWLIAMAGVSVWIYDPISRFGTELLELWSRGLVLVPALVVAIAAERFHLVVRGALFSLIAAALGGGPEVLAGGLALAALGLRSTPLDPLKGTLREDGGVQAVQRAWSAALVLATALLATYPWVREEPLTSFLRLLGWRSPWLALGAALVLVAGLGWGLEIWRRLELGQKWPAPRAATVVVAVLALALVNGFPVPALVPIPYEPVVLRSEQPIWVHRFDSQPISGGTIDCHLIRGAALPAGTPVAAVKVRGSDGKLLGSWQLLAGFDTAEWAAARPDVAGQRGFLAPPAWLSQISPDGTFFAQRFRARFHAAPPLEAAVIAVRRSSELPADVELALYRLELRR